MKTKLLKIRWPEIDKEVLVKPQKENQKLFDWFLENTPVKSVMGHAVVSGKHLYTMNIPMRKPNPYKDVKWFTVNRNKAPFGTVGIFVTAGGVGSVLIKYGVVTEIAAYPGVLGQVRKEDIKVLEEAGAMIWDAVYNTKKIITCQFEEA